MSDAPPDQQKSSVAPQLPFPGGLPLHVTPTVTVSATVRRSNRLRQRLDELDRIQARDEHRDQAPIAPTTGLDIVRLLPKLARAALLGLAKEIAGEIRKTGVKYIAKIIICGALIVVGAAALWLLPAQNDPATPAQIQLKSQNLDDVKFWQKGTTVRSGSEQATPK